MKIEERVFRGIQPFRPCLLAGVITALAGVAITVFMPNEYISTARILPTDPKSNLGANNLAALAATAGLSLPGSGSSETGYLDILNSRWMAENLLTETYSFRQRAWILGSPRPRQESLLDYFCQKNLDKGVSALGKAMKTQRDLKTGLITIEVSTKNPELSQAVARHAVAGLEEFVKRRSRTRGGNKARFVEARLGEAKEAYCKAEEILKGFLDANRNFQTSLDPAIRLRGERLGWELTLQRQLVSTLTMSYEQALLEEKDDTPILNVLDPGNLPIEKDWPPRTIIVVALFIFGALGRFLVERRDRILTVFRASLEESPER